MNRHFAGLASLVLAAALVGCASGKPVGLGIDRLRDEHFAILQGKRVGLVINPASVDRHRQATVLILQQAPGVKLVALFGPEHGIWGDEYAGKTVADNVDPITGLPALSLYGKNKKPSPELLDKIDTMVLDLQDIGARSYTNINTMKQVLLACAAADKELVILDRPNPLGGNRIEGGPVEDKKYESGVSSLHVPYIHGMTMGELALMTRDALVPTFQKLHVETMQGWHRDMMWNDTGLDWIPTSPHVPHVSSVAAYAATGVLGELYQISNGVGYTLPFEIVGAPEVDGVALADKMNRVWPNQSGVFFRSLRFKPFYATHAGEHCGGVQVHLDARTAPSLVEINYRLIEAIGGETLMKIAGTPTTLPSFGDDDEPTTKPTTQPATTRATSRPTYVRRLMFDKVTGGPEIGERLLHGEDLAPAFAQWRAYCEAFRKQRAKYLLY